MENIRVKVSIRLNQNHALSLTDLEKLKPTIARGIASSLPDSIFVDVIEVTKIKGVEDPTTASAGD